MKRIIIPTVFSRSKEEFYSRLSLLMPLSKNIQIDIMDGIFVEGKSVGLREIKGLDDSHIYEAHLMVVKPYEYLRELKRKGFKKIIFHYESCDAEEIKKTIFIASKLKLIVFIAINPETSLTPIIPFLEEVDGVLFMGVAPGRERQKFIRKTYLKIKELKRINKKIVAQIDGGVNLRNIKLLKKAGADILNTGSFVADSSDPKKTLASLRNAFC